MGELAAFVRSLLDALDQGDAEAATELISPEAQGIDEVSRSWARGPGELIAFARDLIGTTQDLRSEIHDPHEVQWGDTGIVTFWLEQDYTSEGKRHHVSAPTTYVLRWEDGGWKLVLGHSVPPSAG